MHVTWLKPPLGVKPGLPAWKTDNKPTELYPSPPPVATLQGHLWSNVCSKFYENRGILNPISQNGDMGFFLPEISWNPP